MRTGWQDGSPQLSGKEADQLVELWLRSRVRPEPETNNTSVSIAEVAEALGAREDELSPMLADLRARNRQRLRPAMSIGRSWRLILAIYAVAGSIALLIYSLDGRETMGYGYRSGYAAYAPVAPTSFRTHLPTGVGFSYRGIFAPARSNTPSESIDWTRTEKALIDEISRINGQHATLFEPLVPPQELTDALSPRGHDFTEYAPGEVQESVADSGRLVDWNSLSVTIGGHEMRTIIPSAKVSNEAVEKAVAKDIKQRIEGMLKALQARVSPSDTSESDPSL